MRNLLIISLFILGISGSDLRYRPNRFQTCPPGYKLGPHPDPMIFCNRFPCVSACFKDPDFSCPTEMEYFKCDENEEDDRGYIEIYEKPPCRCDCKWIWTRDGCAIP